MNAPNPASVSTHNLVRARLAGEEARTFNISVGWQTAFASKPAHIGWVSYES
jgi:hypothetical protein